MPDRAPSIGNTRPSTPDCTVWLVPLFGAVVQHSYTARGDGRGIFEWPTFYELEANGVRLVDWLDTLIAR